MKVKVVPLDGLFTLSDSNVILPSVSVTPESLSEVAPLQEPYTVAPSTGWPSLSKMVTVASTFANIFSVHLANIHTNFHVEFYAYTTDASNCSMQFSRIFSSSNRIFSFQTATCNNDNDNDNKKYKDKYKDKDK